MTVQRLLPMFGLLALFALPSATRSQETLSYGDLVKRMTDLTPARRLACSGRNVPAMVQL